MPRARCWDEGIFDVVLLSLAGCCFLERNKDVFRDVFLGLRVIPLQGLNGGMGDVKTMTALGNESRTWKG